MGLVSKLIILSILFSTVACADITTGLVGWWKFNEGNGTTAHDASGTGNPGTLKPTGSEPSWVSGKIDKALLFNGSTQYVDVTNASSLEPASLTVSAWVNLTSLSTNNNVGGCAANTEYIVFKQNARAGLFEGYVLVSVNNGSGWQFVLTSSGGNQNVISSTTNYATGQWVMLTGTFNQPTMNFYVNGVSQGTASHNFAIDYGANDIFFGQTGAAWNCYLNGNLDDVRIYNRALSSADVTQLYNDSVMQTKMLRHARIGKMRIGE